MRFHILCAAILAVVVLGCSSGSNPVAGPTGLTSQGIPSQADAVSSHNLWGYWQVKADPGKGTLDVVPFRTALMHVNVVPLLEPPAGLKLKISNLHFTDLICDVDVTLVHPFPGLSQYIGFDVAGIFISDGTLAGFTDPDLVMAGPGETRLLNPDGFTRWWNPLEFSVAGQPILRYRDGLLGTKNSVAHFGSTLNGYKLFSDDLNKDANITSSLTPADRVPFIDGSSNTRHYTIDFADGIVFNYAVDANWEPPVGDPPFTPDQYAPEANRPEAWAVMFGEQENTFYNEGNGNLGGDLSLLLEVWDHYSTGLNKVWVESPGNFPPATLTAIGGGDGYSTYQLDIVDATPAEGSIDLLIGVESEVVGYWDVLPDEPITAYFSYTAQVSGTQTAFAPTALMHATTPTDINFGEDVSFDATDSTGTPPLTFTWDFNGNGTYGDAGDEYVGDPTAPTHTFTTLGDSNVTVKVTNAQGFDISDPVLVKVSYDPLDIFVDADYAGSDSNGTPQKPYKTIQEGVNAVTSGHTVHVDYYDGGSTHTYDGASLKSSMTLLGDNWNGGGPGKPKADSTTNYWTFSMSSLSNVTLEGFEIGMGEVGIDANHYGVSISGYGQSNITIRHNKFTDDLVDADPDMGGGTLPIFVSNCSNLLIEYNDIGPINWQSDIGGEYASVLFGMYLDSCPNSEIKNNFIHDFTMDYDGDGSFEQIRMFCVSAYNCNGLDIHNNLISHIEGINDYSYRIQAYIAEAYYTTTPSYQFHNNTTDLLDNSTADPSYNSMAGLCFYGISGYMWSNTWMNNELMTNLKMTGSAYAYIESWGNPYEITYSTGYQVTSCPNYFVDLTVGDGCVNSPGVDPKYVNNTTQPYDYHFQSGSGCEMGDPNFIDWDDTGTPSGNPNESNIENRSRMGCFGGPDGDWDPNNL